MKQLKKYKRLLSFMMAIGILMTVMLPSVSRGDEELLLTENAEIVLEKEEASLENNTEDLIDVSSPEEVGLDNITEEAVEVSESIADTSIEQSDDIEGSAIMECSAEAQLSLLRVSVVNNETMKVQLSIFNLNGDGKIDMKREFWVTEPIAVADDIDISGTGAKIVKPYVVLTVPKLNIIEQPTFVDSQNTFQNIKIINEDTDNYYIIYKFEELTGGFKATFPFQFKQELTGT